jgi:hypothetical protein
LKNRNRNRRSVTTSRKTTTSKAGTKASSSAHFRHFWWGREKRVLLRLVDHLKICAQFRKVYISPLFSLEFLMLQ